MWTPSPDNPDQAPRTRHEILDGVMLEAAPNAFEMHQATIFELNRNYERERERAQRLQDKLRDIQEINERWRYLANSQQNHIEQLNRHRSVFARLRRWFRWKREDR